MVIFSYEKSILIYNMMEGSIHQRYSIIMLLVDVSLLLFKTFNLFYTFPRMNGNCKKKEKAVLNFINLC